MLGYFAQSAHFCVHKQTNKQTDKDLDRQGNQSTPFAQARTRVISGISLFAFLFIVNCGLIIMLAM